MEKDEKKSKKSSKNKNSNQRGEVQPLNNPNNNNNIKMIIGIDFGTSGLGFAYGKLNDICKQVNNGYFDGQGQNNKILNEK